MESKIGWVEELIFLSNFIYLFTNTKHPPSFLNVEVSQGCLEHSLVGWLNQSFEFDAQFRLDAFIKLLFRNVVEYNILNNH